MSQEHPVPLFWREWTIAKAGYTPEQNEDACLACEFKHEDGSTSLLIALSDGASETVYSRLWSRKLVEAAEPDWLAISDDELKQRLQRVRQGFSPMESESLTPFTKMYVRNKFLSQGSQATLLVLTVAGSKDADSLTIRAVSVGDCCLLLFREDGGVCPFPVHSSEDFGLDPELVRSRSQERLDCKRWEDRMGPGDLLLVCTDAVGKWALQCLESNPSRAGLIFEALLGLLVPVASRPTHMVEELPTAIPSPPSEKMSEDVGPSEDDNVEGDSLWGLMRRLMQRFGLSHDPLNPGPPPSRQEATAEPVTAQTVLIGEEATADNDQQEAQEPVFNLRLDFEQFIERYRAPESQPRMRDDDSTLLVCLPVGGAGDDQQRKALEVIRMHQESATRRPPIVRPGG